MRHELAIAELGFVIEIKGKRARELVATRTGNNEEQRSNLLRAEAIHAQITELKSAMAVLQEDAV